MRYHDYHLAEYEVSDGGETIDLHLVYDYPGTDRDQSRIRFSGVALYHFVHTAKAIITDIDEIPLADLLLEIESEATEWQRMYGINLWEGAFQNYAASLYVGAYRAWRIESAIGFYGFVIAKEVTDA